MIAKLILALFSVILAGILSVWIMVKGWGIQPYSWTVIVWGMVLQWILITVTSAASASLED